MVYDASGVVGIDGNASCENVFSIVLSGMGVCFDSCWFLWRRIGLRISKLVDIAVLGRMDIFTAIQIGRVCSTVRLVKGSAAVSRLPTNPRWQYPLSPFEWPSIQRFLWSRAERRHSSALRRIDALPPRSPRACEHYGTAWPRP